MSDVIDNVDAKMRFTSGMSEAQFFEDQKTIDAVERCLLRISEAAVKLADGAEVLVPGQPWAAIRGIGNRLRHDYDGVELPLLWLIVSRDLMSLRVACQSALDRSIDQGN